MITIRTANHNVVILKKLLPKTSPIIKLGFLAIKIAENPEDNSGKLVITDKRSVPIIKSLTFFFLPSSFAKNDKRSPEMNTATNAKIKSEILINKLVVFIKFNSPSKESTYYKIY